MCEKISTQHDAERNTYSSSLVITDDLDNAQVLSDMTKNDGDKEKQLYGSCDAGAFPKNVKLLSSNALSQQKKNKENNNLELLIAKSPSAIQSCYSGIFT